MLSFYSNDFGVFQSKTKDFAIQNMGERGYHFVSIAHSISSLDKFFFSLNIVNTQILNKQTSTKNHADFVHALKGTLIYFACVLFFHTFC